MCPGWAKNKTVVWLTAVPRTTYTNTPANPDQPCHGFAIVTVVIPLRKRSLVELKIRAKFCVLHPKAPEIRRSKLLGFNRWWLQNMLGVVVPPLCYVCSLEGLLGLFESPAVAPRGLRIQLQEKKCSAERTGISWEVIIKLMPKTSPESEIRKLPDQTTTSDCLQTHRKEGCRCANQRSGGLLKSALSFERPSVRSEICQATSFVRLQEKLVLMTFCECLCARCRDNLTHSPQPSVKDNFYLQLWVRFELVC